MQLAKRGANVVVNYVSEGSKARAQEVVDEITKIGTKAILCQASVMKLEEIPRLVEAALKISETGKIEIIVHKLVYHASEKGRLNAKTLDIKCCSWP